MPIHVTCQVEDVEVEAQLDFKALPLGLRKGKDT